MGDTEEFWGRDLNEVVGYVSKNIAKVTFSKFGKKMIDNFMNCNHYLAHDVEMTLTELKKEDVGIAVKKRTIFGLLESLESCGLKGGSGTINKERLNIVEM